MGRIVLWLSIGLFSILGEAAVNWEYPQWFPKNRVHGTYQCSDSFTRWTWDIDTDNGLVRVKQRTSRGNSTDIGPFTLSYGSGRGASLFVQIKDKTLVFQSSNGVVHFNGKRCFKL